MARGGRTISNYFALTGSRDLLEKTVDELEIETQKLANEIHNIKSSKRYAEKVLKDRYHVTDQNESIIFFAQ